MKTQKYISLEESDDLEQENNMMSVIEYPSLPAGDYELEVFIHKFLFLEMQGVETCLSFQMMTEYVVTSQYSSSTMYEVLSIMPSMLQDLHDGHRTKVEVVFNKEVDVDELSKYYRDDQHICMLENKLK